MLRELGFATHGEEDAGGLRPFLLTEDGHAFDDAANVYDDREEARRLLREAYLRTPATQALMQGLHGRGSVPVAGALHLLARHRLADPNDVSGFRGMLTVLNSMGVVSYSTKHQTVRIVAPMPDGEAPPSRVRVVEPERPYSNIRHLRETIRSCKKYVWWADPHFEKRGFEPLTDEADSTKIEEIRILSGTRPSPAEAADYKRFSEEMKLLGISVEYRVVAPPERSVARSFHRLRGQGVERAPARGSLERQLQRVHRDGSSSIRILVGSSDPGCNELNAPVLPTHSRRVELWGARDRIMVNLIRPDVVEELLREHRARQADAVAAEKVVALRKREASLMKKQEEVFLRFEGDDAARVLDRVSSDLAQVRSDLASMQEAVEAIDFTASDLSQAIEAVVGTATQKASLRSHEDLRRLVRMLDVRVDLVERDQGRSVKVTGRISVPELNASYGA